MDIADVEAKLKESINYPYSFADTFINPVGQFFDGRNLFTPVFSQFDQRISANYLYISESQLDILRQYCRWIYETNISAKNALPALCKYVIAGGFTYTIAPKKYKDVSEEELQAAQEIVDNFIEKNDWNTLEADIWNRTHRDGDSFIYVIPQSDGISAVRVIPPEYIRSPFSIGVAQSVEGTEVEWKFGVRTVSPDSQTAVSYCMIYYDKNGSQTFKIIPADEMVQIKVNVDYGMKRGISDFFALQEILINCAKLQDAALKGEQARSAIAFLRQWAMANQQTIQTLQSNATSYYEPQLTVANGNPQQTAIQQIHGGSVLDIPDGLQFMPPPVGNSDNVVKLLQGAYQQLAAWFGCPQWLVSGDSDATNHASALVSESPFIKSIEFRQKFFSRQFKKVMKRVLEIAVEQGELSAETLKNIQIDIECESAHVRDAAEEAKTNETLYKNRVMSKLTWQLRSDLDPDIEEANMLLEEPPEMEGDNSDENNPESNTPEAKYQQDTK